MSFFDPDAKGVRLRHAWAKERAARPAAAPAYCACSVEANLGVSAALTRLF
jgi:hypothetical protein